MNYKLFISAILFTSIIFSYEDKELIFIYNTKSGLVNEMVDFAHKIVSSKTYDCNLYAISYNTFTKKKRWSDYINSLPIKSVFTYKDKVSSLGKELSNLEFPTIIFRNGVELNEIISRNEINNINNINQLISLLNERLDENGMELKKGKDKNVTEQEWEKKLTPEEFHILREKGTEKPFTGEYDKFDKKGMYKCAGCGTELFSSVTKYDSGCGWPAFYEALPDKIEETADNTFGMKRIEITCENCGGHLGHVFNDGPQPSGLRYCVNSISLDFDSEK
jgi:peptide-methionine (R)-S-oxide reductase